ncbi:MULTISPECIES: hypothetical protein [Xanthomonas]|uniref:Uncharacterized protein n=1 Tax=Xanthomonas hortorum pv. hederae TaxID=453603 RepID=A0A9X4BVW4_9XANT|nr:MULTISPECIES: hypothetical protein [Xanthomonas]MDC8640596.1 hypothetical protein [Xanthomonas hortorum pv. hederae]QUI79253.1 hypothetical protein ICA18_13235 [Xanthomonas arboricola pv. corylina]
MTTQPKDPAYRFTCRRLGDKETRAIAVVPIDSSKAQIFSSTSNSEKKIERRFSLLDDDFDSARTALEAVPPTTLSFYNSLIKFFDTTTGAKVIEFFWVDRKGQTHPLTYQVVDQDGHFALQRSQNLIAATGSAQALSARILKQRSQLDASASASSKDLSGSKGPK